MKQFIFLALLLHSTFCFGQDCYSLVAKSYILMINGTNTKVNDAISLTYNREFTILYIQGKGTTSFHNEQYTRELIEGQLHESYLSDETGTTLYGHYNVHIFHQKNQNIFEVVSPGVTFYVENAQLYSETGKVVQNPYVQNWKELMDKEIQRKKTEEQKSDSIKAYLAQVRIKDSIDVVRRDSLKKVDIEKQLQSGNTYITIDRNTEEAINKGVESVLPMKRNETIYSSWVIRIDNEGNIIDAYPDNNYKGGYIISEYIPAINKALMKQKVKPYIAYNGKRYPSYSTVYINVSNYLGFPNKNNKQSLLNRILK